MQPFASAFVLIITSLATAAPVRGQSPPGGETGWTPELVQAAVTNCREIILDNTTRDYLKRNNLAVKDLPPDFRARVTPMLEPLLRTCDCMIGTLSREFTFEEFQVNTLPVQARTRELASEEGACAAPS